MESPERPFGSPLRSSPPSTILLVQQSRIPVQLQLIAVLVEQRHGLPVASVEREKIRDSLEPPQNVARRLRVVPNDFPGDRNHVRCSCRGIIPCCSRRSTFVVCCRDRGYGP